MNDSAQPNDPGSAGGSPPEASEQPQKGRVRDRPGTMAICVGSIVSRNRNVKSAPDDRHAVVRFIEYIRHHLVLVLIAISIGVLIVFPLADCFDCEGPQPWGRNDAAYATRSMLFDYSLVGASLLAGVSRRRFGWTVPVAITLIACVQLSL
jgi:hypothetical protein